MGWLFPDPECPACGVKIDNVNVTNHHIHTQLCGSCGNKRVASTQKQIEKEILPQQDNSNRSAQFGGW